MAKKILDALLDAMLDAVEGTHFAITSAEPTDYTNMLTVDLVNTSITGSYTAAAGDVSGRKNTFPAQTGASIIADGTATHFCTHNNTDTLYVVTTVTSQALTTGGTVDTNAWDHELADPT